MKKIILLILFISFIIDHLFPLSTTQAESSYVERNVIVYSTLINRKENVTLLLNKDTVYMKLDQILEYTGYLCKYNLDDSVLNLDRSGKRVTLYRGKNQLSNGKNTISIPEILEYQEILWIPLYPTLLYLNARCETIDKYLVIIAAETTMNEYISKFYNMVNSQLCTIQWADNEDKWYYDTAVVFATVLDVIFNDKIGSVLTFQYETDRCKSMLLNIMDEIDEDSYSFYAKHYPDIIENTKWYNDLDKYSKVEVDEVLTTIKIVDFTGEVIDLADYFNRVYNIQEFHINMVDQVILKGSKYFSNSFKKGELYKAANDILSLYKSKRTGLNEVTSFLKKQTSDLIYESTIYDKLLKIKDGKVIALTGIKLLVEYMGYNKTYDDFLTIKSMYLLQKEIEKAISTAINESNNDLAFSTEQVDFLYNSTLLYIQIRRAADKLQQIHADKVDKIYQTFLMVDLDTLYFDDINYLSENRITSDDIASLLTDQRLDSWIGIYDEYIKYDNRTIELSKKWYFKEEYIPYIELFSDGTYYCYMNWYDGMGKHSGIWQIEPYNENMIRLFKTELFDYDFLFERVSESEIILREPEWVSWQERRVHSTSMAGDVFLKRGEQPYTYTQIIK
ncbi:MAG: hypothetical protein GX757_08670 [Clostridiales bacterium]|nr:hypothetical protein [Clostridiales bacterium]